jgi:hypothetical protein
MNLLSSQAVVQALPGSEQQFASFVGGQVSEMHAWTRTGPSILVYIVDWPFAAGRQPRSFLSQVMDGNALVMELLRLGMLGDEGFSLVMPTTSSFRIAIREAYAGMFVRLPFLFSNA